MADRQVVRYTNVPDQFDTRDWCVTIGYWHAFQREETPNVYLGSWVCVHCGRHMVGRMPVSMRFYLIEEEPW